MTNNVTQEQQRQWKHQHNTHLLLNTQGKTIQPKREISIEAYADDACVRQSLNKHSEAIHARAVRCDQASPAPATAATCHLKKSTFGTARPVYHEQTRRPNPGLRCSHHHHAHAAVAHAHAAVEVNAAGTLRLRIQGRTVRYQLSRANYCEGTMRRVGNEEQYCESVIKTRREIRTKNLKNTTRRQFSDCELYNHCNLRAKRCL